MSFRIKRYFLLIAFFLLLFFLTVTAGFFWYIYQFDKAAGISFTDLRSLLIQTRQEKTSSFNFLFLGLDTRPSSNTMLTDTMIVGLFRPSENKLIFLSVPRDLWIDSLKTKINALYYYGQQKDPNDGTSLVKEEIQKVTSEDIDYSIILNFGLVSDIVDTVGGIEINVDEAFDDDHYPRGDDSGKTMHIHFDRGQQSMDGLKVLQYIRSRQSADPQEGNDEARVKRQQKVAQSIFKKISSRAVITNPIIAGELYRIWQEKINSDLPLPLLLKAGMLSSGQKGINLCFLSLPQDLLIHPPLSKHNNLWVWEPVGGNWEQIKEWIRETTND